jgi:mannosyltransferase PIG-V
MPTSAISPPPPVSDRAPAPLPRWATILDLLTLFLIGVALLLVAFGGLRLRFAGIRLSIMTPWRPLLWAAAVAVVRHAIVRRDPVYARALEWARVTQRSEAFAASWPVFLATRLSVLAIGYFAVLTIGYPQTVPPFRVYENELRNLPARWDTGWYLAIATGGYRWSPEVTGQQNVAFFPAYPLLMRMAGRVLRDETLWAGVVISLAAFFAALVYFYRLAREWLDAPAAAVATALLATYPFALFYSAAYTESLFLLAAVAAIYHLRRDELVAAGVWGVLAGLTRPNGCLLAIPLALVVVERRRAAGHSVWAIDRQLVRQLAAAAMPVAGLAIFSAFLFRLTGNPLEWARSHAAWGRTFRGVHRIVLDRYDFISEYGLYEYTVSLPVDVMNGIAAVFALGMTWPVWRRVGVSAAAFMLVNLLPPLAMGGLLSIGRVTSILFPMFIGLALLVHPSRRQIWLIGFAMVQAFFAALFFTWRPLY